MLLHLTYGDTVGLTPEYDSIEHIQKHTYTHTHTHTCVRSLNNNKAGKHESSNNNALDTEADTLGVGSPQSPVTLSGQVFPAEGWIVTHILFYIVQGCAPLLK